MNSTRTLGFLGTGVIAESIVEGICAAPEIRDTALVVSPRNAQRASALSARYPNVSVAASNQEVVDRADWVFLSVVPSVAEVVVRSLVFRREQTLVSLVASKRLDTVSSWIAPPSASPRLFRMVPMPFIARRTGPITLCPTDAEIERFFAHLGTLVVMEQEPQVEITNAITSLTNATYTVIQNTVSWGERLGLTHEQSLSYTTGYFHAMCEQIRGERAENLPRFVEERTPGGMNDAALRYITEAGGFRLWEEALDIVIRKIRADYPS